MKKEWTIEQVKGYMEPHRNDENAIPMTKYMKNHFPFLGIKTPERRLLFKTMANEMKLPPYEEMEKEVWELFQLEEREYHYIAIELLSKYKTQLSVKDLPFCQRLVETKSWWDSVDSLAPKIVADIVIANRMAGETVMVEWAKSSNLWTNRASILHQLKYKEKTNEELLFATIERHSASKEFFLQKSIGWVLREYAKTRPQVVQEFVGSHKLAPLSKREALKHFK